MLDLTAKSAGRHLLQSRGVTLVEKHVHHENPDFLKIIVFILQGIAELHILSISFLFNVDHLLTESEDIRILQEGGRHSLIIPHVTKEDEGFYIVTARNCHGEAETSAELYIQEPRPAISSQM